MNDNCVVSLTHSKENINQDHADTRDTTTLQKKTETEVNFHNIVGLTTTTQEKIYSPLLYHTQTTPFNFPSPTTSSIPTPPIQLASSSIEKEAMSNSNIPSFRQGKLKQTTQHSPTPVQPTTVSLPRFSRENVDKILNSSTSNNQVPRVLPSDSQNQNLLTITASVLFDTFEGGSPRNSSTFGTSKQSDISGMSGVSGISGLSAFSGMSEIFNVHSIQH